MTCELSAIEIHTHLLELRVERVIASIEGVASAAFTKTEGRAARRRCGGWEECGRAGCAS